MRITIALLTAVLSATAAQPHVGHKHQHLHARQDEPSVTDVEVVSGPTVVAYVLNGQPISEQDVQQGIANGTLVWAPNGGLSDAASSLGASPATSVSASSATDTSTSSPPPPPPTTTSAVSTSSSSAPPPPASSATFSSSGSGDDSSFDSDSSQGVDSEFPDGQLDCSEFPSDYGAIAVPWVGLGGWTGVQQPGSNTGANTGGYSDIMTVTTGTCQDGQNCCAEGMFCSYACPAGYQKTQWPSTQGATGQSVGGIQCLNGKLHLTNPSMSNSLCMTGASEVTVLVENNLSKNVAVCRTDYPGTEGETIPLNAAAGTTSNLTCPDASNYYNWEGAHTSAQYYVNPAGVSVSDACQWGSSANPWGNFAPLNLGVGYSSGAAWLSIFQNAPTTDAQLDFTVEITGDDMSGTCKYSNGQYCGGANYDECSSTTGCTVSISSGTATFVFSDS